MKRQTVVGKKVHRDAEEKTVKPGHEPAHGATKSERGRAWDGSIVIKEDIFGNKWAST